MLACTVFACPLVWIVRSAVRYINDDDEEIWSADCYDVAAGIALFIIIAAVGSVIAFTKFPQKIVLIASSAVLSSTDIPEHVTPIQRWHAKIPPKDAIETTPLMLKQVELITITKRSNAARDGPFAPLKLKPE